MILPPFAHFCTQEVRVPASLAFAFLADPARLGRWSLGCFDIVPSDTPGLFHGSSLFDGARGWLRIVPDEVRLEVVYHVGTPERLMPRVVARVMAGEGLGRGADHCIVTLCAWRSADMAEQRWARLCAAHEAEIWLVKDQLEAAERPLGSGPRS